jgi:hypothetical protein
MLEIQNVKIYDLQESVIACRNAMRLTPPEYTQEEFEQSLERAKVLAKTPNSSGHQTFLSGIRVSFDIKYPNYISPELQRYHWVDIVTSASKMHRLMEMDLDMCCNKYVTKGMIDEMKVHIAKYKAVKEDKEDTMYLWEMRDGSYYATYTKKDSLYFAFMRCISNCPQGIELFMRVSTNYLQLKNIYHQRKKHKLIEDWREGFCQNFVEKLPYFEEFIK